MNNRKSFIFFATLFIVATFLSMAYSFFKNKTPFLTLKYNYSQKLFIIFQKDELLSGNKISGEFKAHDNNLGIVEIRFSTYGKISTDRFIFRIKQKQEKEWYYRNTYKAREFGGYSLFPFGFPIINDSKGKQYYFELESLSGKSGDAVGINTEEEPVIIVKHKFTTNQLLTDKKELLLFLLKKSKELIEEKDTRYVFILTYIVLIVSFIIFRFVPQKDFLKSVKKLQVQSKKRSNTLLQLFAELKIGIQLILKIFGLIFGFIVKKLFAFHQWLGKE